MNQQSNRLIGNLALWLIAIVIHPVSQLFKDENGDLPRFFSLLIPLILLMCAAASTRFLNSAYQESPHRTEK